MGSDLAQPVKMQGATIKGIRQDMDSGERVMTIRFPKSEAGKVAQLSLYDGIGFEVTFTPTEALNFGKKTKAAKL